jgi:WD40 repeat protein
MDGRIQFFDIATKKNVKTIVFKDETVPPPLSSIAFCYDGHTIAVGSITGKVLINNLKDKSRGQIEIMIQEGKKINCLRFAKPIKEGSGKNTHLILGSSNLSASPV